MALSGLFRRLGFVKLDDFGLILTPEGRILSARSVVLDDGIGGKIVGWREDDLAAMELERWEPALPRKAGKKVVPAMPQAAKTVAPAGPPPLPGVRPFTGTMPLAAPLPTPPVALPVVAPVAAAPAPIAKPAPAPVVAAPVEEDDEWEWEIAVARARANAEWAAEAAEAAAKTAVTPKKDPMSTDSWPKTEPLLDAWEPSGSPERPVRVLPRKSSPTPPKPIVIAERPVFGRTPARTIAPATEPNIFVGEQTSPTIVTSAQKPVQENTSRTSAAPRSTVIPVPTLPTAIDPKSVMPRPRTTTGPSPMRANPAVMSPPRRVSRGTPSIASRTEDTLVTGKTAPANDDLTSPGLLAPPPASSSKRVAAKLR